MVNYFMKTALIVTCFSFGMATVHAQEASSPPNAAVTGTRGLTDAQIEALPEMQEVERLSPQADALKAAGRDKEAYELTEKAFQLRLSAYSKSQLGQGHPEWIATANGLVFIYLAQQKFEQALPYAQKVYAYNLQRWGASHNETQDSLDRLAGLHIKLKLNAPPGPIRDRMNVLKAQNGIH